MQRAPTPVRSPCSEAGPAHAGRRHRDGGILEQPADSIAQIRRGRQDATGAGAAGRRDRNG
jgi:hypothetical protein